MAATIAKAWGQDRSGRIKETHRLGSESSIAEAATWRTFARVTTFADGSGHVRITRDGDTVHEYAWGSERDQS